MVAKVALLFDDRNMFPLVALAICGCMTSTNVESQDFNLEFNTMQLDHEYEV